MLRLVLIAVFICLFVTEARAEAAFDKEMTFTVQYNGGNCGSCAWVLAEGVIVTGTLAKFKEFVEKNKPANNIRFNSPGGDIAEALKLGAYLRENKWDTFASEQGAIIPGSLDDYVNQKSVCYSACVYAFAGGVNREAEDRSLGIHQFYRPDDAAHPNNEVLSALDLSHMQRLSGLLNEYVRQMGVDPRLVTMASTITPWEPIRILDKAEIDGLNLDTYRDLKQSVSAEWSVKPIGDGAMAISHQAQDGAGREASMGLMCLKGQPEMVIVQLAIKDTNKDWKQAYDDGFLSLQNFTFELDGEYTELPVGRLVGKADVLEYGVSLSLYITKTELKKIMNADSANIEGFASMVSYRQVGPLGGVFGLNGAAQAIGLAMKNCIGDVGAEVK